MRRMYSKNELKSSVKAVIDEYGVESLVGKDISVNGITSKGIANTGGLANIGDVVISGDLTVQGENKGVITCKELKEEYDTALIDLSEYIDDTLIKSHTLYSKMEIKHGVLMIIVSGVFVTKEISSATNITILNNFYSILPDAVKDKIYRSDGTPINSTPTTAPYFSYVVGMISPRSHSGSQSQNQAILTSVQAGNLGASLRGFPALAEDTSVFIDVRFILSI